MEFYNNPNKTYTSEKGRKFRVSGIEKVLDTERVEWENRKPKYSWHWKVLIIFLDDKDPKKLKLTYDHNDRRIKKEVVI